MDLAQKGGEAELRSAVSRLYYALFHVARQRTEVGASTTSAHTAVVIAVKRRDWSTGDQLDSLRKLRTAADYDLVPDPSRAGTDWQANWQRAQAIASHILPKLLRM